MYCTAFGLGFGHASRMVGLGRELRRIGLEPVFSSFGEGRKMLTREFPDAPVYGLPKMELFSEDGSFDLFLLLRRHPDLPLRFYAGVEADRRVIRRHGCKVVVSDCQFHALVAAQIMGIPAIVISNMLRIPGEGSLVRLINGTLRRMFELADIVLIPDTYDDTYDVPEIDTEVVWVGPVLKRRPDELLPRDAIRRKYGIPDDATVVLVTAGGSKYSRQIVRVAVEGLNLLSKSIDVFPVIVSEERVGGGLGLQLRYVDNLLELIKVSNVVVTHGGHTTLSECACLRTPVVSVPLPNHPEQHVNAERVLQRGLGVAVLPEELSSERIAKAIEQAIDWKVPKIRMMDGRGAERAARIVSGMLD
ncbi:UDP-N-acetylglucosamine--N-acetylmuramyl-(pentapeptide) pyrophosphoryl-undecaprenol N-acetylglucosamine transferase [Methanopyrus sp.]